MSTLVGALRRPNVAARLERLPMSNYQRALFGLLARPSDMTVHRGQAVIPEPSGPPDPRSAD